MASAAIKLQVKNAIDTMSDEQILRVLNFVSIMNNQYSHSEDYFPFDNLVHHTDRADHADEYIRNFRDTDRF